MEGPPIASSPPLAFYACGNELVARLELVGEEVWRTPAPMGANVIADANSDMLIVAVGTTLFFVAWDPRTFERKWTVEAVVARPPTCVAAGHSRVAQYDFYIAHHAEAVAGWVMPLFECDQVTFMAPIATGGGRDIVAIVPVAAGLAPDGVVVADGRRLYVFNGRGDCIFISPETNIVTARATAGGFEYDVRIGDRPLITVNPDRAAAPTPLQPGAVDDALSIEC